MKLDYKIIWFDDNDFETDRLQYKMQELGFHLEINFINNFDDSNEVLRHLSEALNFDLIVMDYNLGSVDLNGATLSKHLRNADILTDIVFYSSEPSSKLREHIYQEEVDGVFCINRRELVDETFKIIKNHIRKVIDINHMRGIVMDVTSDFDHSMANIVKDTFDTCSREEINTELMQYMMEKVIASAETTMGKVREITTPIELIEHRAFTSEHKRVALLKLCKKLGINTENISTFEAYKSEILDPRNNLAHAKQCIHEGRAVIKYKDHIFDEQAFITIRHNMLKHRNNIRSIAEEITQVISSQT